MFISMAVVAQLVRASDCGSEGRGFEPLLSPSFFRILTRHFVTLFESVLLGIFQGFTEFLPISSSGHLLLLQSLLGMKNLDEYILFNLMCHLGTLLAVIMIYFKEINTILFKNRERFFQVIIATLPLFPLVLLMKEIKNIYNSPEFLWIFFLITALILTIGIKYGKVKDESSIRQTKWRDPIIIGCFQALAIFPGVSRSGTTISIAKLLGWKKEEALSFSFLLAIPTILGGVVLETYHLVHSPKATNAIIEPSSYILGTIFSFIVGYGTLKLLLNSIGKDRFYIFAIYCVCISIFCFTIDF